MVHPDNYLVLKRSELSSREKIRRELKCMLLSESNQSKRLYDSNCMTFRKRQNHGGSEKIGGRQELEVGGRMNRQGAEDF